MKNPNPDATPEVQLVLLNENALRHLTAGDIPAASLVAGVDLPGLFVEWTWLWRIRYEQVVRDPAAGPWLVRAVVAAPAQQVVGHAGFHGPPDEQGMVELGYTILPDHRRRGFARAAVHGLIRFAAADPRVRVVRASISPDNVASLAVIRPFGFVQVGEQWDDDDGLELIYETAIGSEDTGC